MKIIDKIEEKLKEHLPSNVKYIRLRFGKNDNNILGYDDTDSVVYITHVEVYTTNEGNLVFIIDIARGVVVIED